MLIGNFSRKNINFLRRITLNLFNLFNYNISYQEKFYAKDFFEYTSENNINIRYAELVNNLDFKSKFVIDTLLSRMVVNRKLIFNYQLTSSEIKQIAKESDYFGKVADSDLTFQSTFYKNLYPNLTSYEIPVFKFHHGLILFNNDLKNYLSNKDCIDGGGFNLESSIVLSSHYPFKNIYSLELDPENHKKGLAILNTYYKNLKNIKSINSGLWNIPAKAVLDSSGNGSIRLRIDESAINNYNLTTIDDFVRKNNLKLGYLKLDIEGSEYNAILGGEKSIKEHLPVMSISIYHNFKDFFEIKPLIEKIAPNQYDFYIRKLAPFYSQHETYLICVPKKLNLKINSFDNLDIYG